MNESFIIQLRRGNAILFWEDDWLGPFSLNGKFLGLYTITAQHLHAITDICLWDGEFWIWDFKWRRPLVEWEMNLVNEPQLLINP